jgi:hypothetical protein
MGIVIFIVVGAVILLIVFRALTGRGVIRA